MKILFDQGTPVPLRRQLLEHHVTTAFEQGWSDLMNGRLLDVAELEGFELLITTDQNLRYQQNLSERRISIIMLRSTSWPGRKPIPATSADCKLVWYDETEAGGPEQKCSGYGEVFGLRGSVRVTWE